MKSVKTDRYGRLFLIVAYTDGYCHWVRAESEAKAKKEIESRSGRSWKQILKGRWVMYKAHPKTRISEESGGLVYPNGHPPLKFGGSDHYRNSEWNWTTAHPSWPKNRLPCVIASIEAASK